jgi:DNA-binding IclR family transcriptional regulator
VGEPASEREEDGDQEEPVEELLQLAAVDQRMVEKGECGCPGDRAEQRPQAAEGDQHKDADVDLVEGVRGGADVAVAVREQAAREPDHRRADDGGENPVAGHVDAGESRRGLVVPERPKGPADAGELQRAEDAQEEDHQAGEEPVPTEPAVREPHGCLREDVARLAARQVLLSEQELSESKREHEGQDAREDHAQRTADRDPAEKPAHEGRAERPECDSGEDRQRGLVGEDRSGVAEPELRRLSHTTGYTSNLAIRDGADVILIDRVRGRSGRYHHLEFTLHVGSRLPAYCSATGKTLLAFLPELELERVLERIELVQRGPRTVTEKRALLEELAQVRRTGLSVNDEELESALRSIAAPVWDRSGEVVAAVNVAIPWSPVAISQLGRELGPTIRETAKSISARLT